VKGTTNAQGEFSFKVPKKTDLKIIMFTSTGHRAEWLIPVREIEMPTAEKKQIQDKSPAVENIIIGLGCILGLAGIAAYIHRRIKKA
jgi:nickel transport protein